MTGGCRPEKARKSDEYSCSTPPATRESAAMTLQKALSVSDGQPQYSHWQHLVVSTFAGLRQHRGSAKPIRQRRRGKYSLRVVKSRVLRSPGITSAANAASCWLQRSLSRLKSKEWAVISPHRRRLRLSGVGRAMQTLSLPLAMIISCRSNSFTFMGLLAPGDGCAQIVWSCCVIVEIRVTAAGRMSSQAARGQRLLRRRFQMSHAPSLVVATGAERRYP